MLDVIVDLFLTRFSFRGKYRWFRISKRKAFAGNFFTRRGSTFVIFADMCLTHFFFLFFVNYLRINITDLGFNLSRWDHTVPRIFFF